MTLRLRGEFECDYCGRTMQVSAPHGATAVVAPDPWMQLSSVDVLPGSAGPVRTMHYCSLPCAWWALRRGWSADENVTVIGRDGPYGPAVKGWEPPPDPRGGQ